MTPLLQRFGRTLAFRFMVVAGLAAAAIVPVRLLELSTVRQQAADAGHAAVARIASKGITRLSGVIDDAKTILSITALLPTFTAPGVPRCEAVLAPIVAGTEWMSSLSTVRADGQITCSTSLSAPGLSIGDRAFFQEAMTRKRFTLSGVVASRVTQAPTVYAILPIAAPGAGTAALMMAINAAWFGDVVQDVAHSTPRGLAMLVDTDGRIMDRSNGTDTGSAPVFNQLAAALPTLAHDRAQRVVLPDGLALVAVVRAIPDSDAVLVVGVPEAELVGQATALETSLLADLAVALGIIVLVFWLGHESFIRPAVQLAAAAEKLGRGEFKVSIDSRQWASEFQTLAGAITTASHSLADRAQADDALKANLWAQSQEDPLTGLKNRRGLDSFVDLAWQTCTRKNQGFAAVAFDIDFFKPFNDRYGHDAGDVALRAVGRLMQEQAREAGGIASRTGGEEFTIVVPGASIETAQGVAEAVSLRVLALQITHGGSPLGTLTISAGVAAAATTDGLTSPDVFRAADAALYGAKDAGRNTITRAAVVRAPDPAPEAVDIAASRSGPAPGTRSRTPPAFPSAMSR